MFKRIATALWGKFENKEELQKFGFLALIFGLIIGIYWTLRPMKDSIFNALVGMDYLPWAKMLSLVFIVPLVIVYSKLIDKYPRHKVFYILIGVYGVAALSFYFVLSNPVLGIANTVQSPSRVIGWAWYVFVESFGSLIVALFWAITTDITAPDSAKRGFPLIALFGQLGNILGPFFLTARRLGFENSAPVVGICAGLMLFLGLLFWFFMFVTPDNQLKGYETKEKEEIKKEKDPGFFEGLKLLFTRGYLFSILMITFIYEVIVTVLDYHFKSTVAATFTAEADVSLYLSQYSYMTGIVSTLCVLFGINSIQRYLGIKVSLLLLPVLVTSAVIIVKFNPTLLAVAFWIMVFSKAVNYALNRPTLKQLYIPTTKNTKYKAQAWDEMFGSRGSKGVGSIINTFRAGFKAKYGMLDGIARFLTFSSLISLSLVGVWIFVALYAAKEYDQAIKEKRVVC
ncbi:MAG TPA: MFS transporter [Candidatus Dependentiae bacterium]|nr:MFS transporter [Candidatus Dependentiae bacterium]